MSSPAYAQDERLQIDTILTRINSGLGGAVRIEAIGQDMIAAVTSDGPAFGAADCDAVIAVMRPRLATDSPASPDAIAAEGRGGVSGVLAAVQGRKAGAGLPDIHIFRYSAPASADGPAVDTDWEAGKQGFAGWFRAKGGDFLSFDDFSTADEFGTRLEAQIGTWMVRHGLAMPTREAQPAPEDEQAATAIGETIEAASDGDTVETPAEIGSADDQPAAASEPVEAAIDGDTVETPAEIGPAVDQPAAAASEPVEAAIDGDTVETPAETDSAETADIPPDEDLPAPRLRDLPPDERDAEAMALAERILEAESNDRQSVDAAFELDLQREAGPIDGVEQEPSVLAEPALAGELLEPEPINTDSTPADSDIAGRDDAATDRALVELQLEGLGVQTSADETSKVTPSPRARGRTRRATRKASEILERTDDLAVPNRTLSPDDIRAAAASLDAIDAPAAENFDEPVSGAVPAPDALAEPDRPEPEPSVQSDDIQLKDTVLEAAAPEAAVRYEPEDAPTPFSEEALAGGIASDPLHGPVAGAIQAPDALAETGGDRAEPSEQSDDIHLEDGVRATAVPEPENGYEPEGVPTPLAEEAFAGGIETDPLHRTVAAEEVSEGEATHTAPDTPAPSAIVDEPPAVDVPAGGDEPTHQTAPSDNAHDDTGPDPTEWAEKYRALEAETRNAVAVALRLERASRPQTASVVAWRRRIAWALAASVIIGLGAALQIVGTKWRSGSVARQQLEQVLASASDQANSLTSDLTQMQQKQNTVSDADKAVLDRARALAGLLAKAGKFNPIETRTTIDGLLASADVLVRQGQVADALKAMGKAQQLLRTAAAAAPDQPEWLLRLMKTDMKIGDIFVGQKNTDEALTAFREAMAIDHALVLREPANIEWQKFLSSAQHNVGDMLVAKGRLDDALAAYREAQAIRKTVSLINSDNPETGRDLLEVDNAIGDLLTAQNHLDDALVSYREALAIATKLAPKNPADLKWSRALVLGNNKIGDVFLAKERIDDALAAYREGLAIVKGLAAKDPDNSEWQSLTATCQERIGDALSAESHQDSALAAYQDGLAIVTAMATKDPLNAELQRGISETQLRIGWVLFNQGKIDASIAAHRDSLAVVKAMIAKHPPDEARWKRDLMLDDGKIAQLLMAQGKHEEALPIYQDALAIAKDMGTQDPGNPEWQGTRGVVDSNVGRLLMEAGNRDEALVAYRDARSVSEALVLKDPGNVDWQTGLVIAYYNLAEAGEDKNTNLLRAVDILKRLDAAGVLPADKKELIPKIDDELTHLTRRSKRH